MEISKPSPPALMTGLARPLPSFRLRTGSLNTLRLRRIFDLFDSDGDGELTATELCDALDRLGLGAEPAELGPIVAVHARAGHPDSLAFDDFRALHGALADALLGSDSAAEEEEADMGEAFKVFDEDGDGFISAAELQAVLAKLGLPEGRSIERVHEMIGSVDRNKDGLVDFLEFKNMMQRITIQGS